jgi:hypothetical protein
MPFEVDKVGLLAPVSNRLAAYEKREYNFSPLRRESRRERSGLSGASSCKPFDPERHFLPCAESYHSGRVIARSAGPRRYTGKLRALARATSGSLTTRIPHGAELRSGYESVWEHHVHPSTLEKFTWSFSRMGSQPVMPSSARPPQLSPSGRVGARAVSNDRTYRRSETEQRSHTNSGETETQSLSENLRFYFEGKSCSSPNLGETVLPEKKTKRQLSFEFEQKRICVRCKRNLTYLNLDICEPCVSEIAGLNQ